MLWTPGSVVDLNNTAGLFSRSDAAGFCHQGLINMQQEYIGLTLLINIQQEDIDLVADPGTHGKYSKCDRTTKRQEYNL